MKYRILATLITLTTLATCYASTPPITGHEEREALEEISDLLIQAAAMGIKGRSEAGTPNGRKDFQWRGEERSAFSLPSRTTSSTSNGEYVPPQQADQPKQPSPDDTRANSPEWERGKEWNPKTSIYRWIANLDYSHTPPLENPYQEVRAPDIRTKGKGKASPPPQRVVTLTLTGKPPLVPPQPHAQKQVTADHQQNPPNPFSFATPSEPKPDFLRPKRKAQPYKQSPKQTDPNPFSIAEVSVGYELQPSRQDPIQQSLFAYRYW